MAASNARLQCCLLDITTVKCDHSSTHGVEVTPSHILPAVSRPLLGPADADSAVTTHRQRPPLMPPAPACGQWPGQPAAHRAGQADQVWQQQPGCCPGSTTPSEASHLRTASKQAMPPTAHETASSTTQVCQGWTVTGHPSSWLVPVACPTALTTCTLHSLTALPLCHPCAHAPNARLAHSPSCAGHCLRCPTASLNSSSAGSPHMSSGRASKGL